ncbi:MAG: ABC transporter permease [Nitrospirae bacterium]|nr:ABC transporter permease [Nitrospirota bacterium]
MKIVVIALNTFRETVREKVLYNLLFFALLMIGSSVLLSTLTIGEQSKIIMDIGLASINIFGILIAIFVGIGLVSKEIEKKTIYTIISKPIYRYQFLLGKYLGLLITLFVNTSIMVIGFFAVLLIMSYNITPDMIKAILLIYVEMMVVTAVALMFSTFTTSALSAIFTISIYVIGHLLGDLKAFAAKLGNPVMVFMMDALYYILPNLENFNIKGEVVHNIALDPSFIVMSVLYGLLYITMILLSSVIIFQRRDFK